MSTENRLSRRIAALDVGSLTVRLALAETTGAGRFRILLHRREVTSLGAGLAQTGELAPDAMARTLEALRNFKKIMESHGVQHCRAVGTQALRQARNREDFREQAREVLGLEVQVLSPEEEARLSLTGVLSVLNRDFLQGSPILVFDVGGGSSEFALVRPGQPPVFAGLPLGVLTLSQAQPVGDPPDPDRVAALQQEVERQLTGFVDQTLKPHLPGPPTLVGTAGAVTTLAAMQLQLTDYDPQKINNLLLTAGQVTALAELVSRLPEAERARLPGMEPAKAGVMVAGALIILTILKVFRQNLLIVVDAGLLEGVLLQISLEF